MTKEDAAPKPKSKKQQESKKGRPGSAGRRKGKFDGFFAQKTERRLRHVCRRNGSLSAYKYANKKGCIGILRKIAGEQTFAGRVAREALS